jgi:hypothetical protein
MWRLLILISVLPIVVSLLARWWFGLRVLANHSTQVCRCDLEKWNPLTSGEKGLQRAEASAAEFGRQVRLASLTEWRTTTPAAAISREKSKRFGMAVPPLSGLIAVLAVFAAKVPIIGALAIFLAATATATALGVITIAPELLAVTRYTMKLRGNQAFPNNDEQEAVMRCAIAHVWKEAVPPILALLQR